MALQRTVNVRFLCILAGSLVLLTLGVAFLHGYQVQRNAKVIKDRAQQAEDGKEFERAARYYQTYLGYVPNDVEAKKAQARCLEHKEEKRKTRADWTRELFLLEQVLQREPENHEIRRRVIQLTMGMQRVNDAIEHITELLKSSPKDAELERWYAACLVRKGDDVQAEQLLRKAVEHDKQDLAGYRDLTDLLVNKRKAPAEANKVMEAMVKENNGRYEAHLLRADYLLGRGQQQDAAKEVAEAVKLEPKNILVIMAAAQIALAQGKLDEARGHLQRGLKEHPANAEMVRMLARVQLRDNHVADAVATLRRGAEIASEDSRNLIRNDLAEILIQRGDPQAEDVIQQLRDGRAPQVMLDELAARQSMQKGQWLQASHLLESVRAQASSSGQRDIPQIDVLLGYCYENLGEPDRALVVYRKALASDPQSKAARGGVASALRAMGKGDEALLEYRSITSTDPATALKMAELLIARNKRQDQKEKIDWQEVKALLDQAAKETPGTPAIAGLRAEVLLAQGEVDKALALVKEACVKQPDQLESWLALIRITQIRDGAEKALAVLEEATRKLGDRAELRLVQARYWSRRWDDKEAAVALAKLERDTQQLGSDERRFLEELADIYYQGGHSEQAGRLWTALLEKDPNSLRLRLMLFDLALQKGDDSVAAKMLGDLKQVEGDQGTVWRYAEACANLAKAKREKDDETAKEQRLKTATSLLEEVAAQRPSWGAVPLRLAEIHFLEGNREAAIRAMNQAAELGESSPQILRQVIESLFRAQRYQEAQQLLAKIPGEAIPNYVARLGDRLKIQNKDFEGAIARARQAVQRGSKDPGDHLWLAQVLAASGDRKHQAEAEQTIRKALDLSGADKAPDLWIFLVRFLAVTGHKNDAEASVQLAKQRLAPEFAELAAGQCWELLDQPQKALEEFQAALKARPDDAAVLASVAGFHLRHRQFAQAEPYLRALIKPTSKATDADRNWARRTLALGLAGSGDYAQYDQALAYLEENAKASPGSLEDLRAKATILSMNPSARSEAVQLFEDLARKEPPTLEEQLVRARLYEQIGERAKAYREYVEVASISQDPGQVADCGRQLLNLGEIDEAQRCLKKLDLFDGQARRKVGPEIMELRVSLLTKQGKIAEAAGLVKQFQQAPGVDQAFVATLFEKVGEASAAEEIYQRLAKSQNPEDALRLAAFLGRQGRISDALNVCEQVWDACPPESVAGITVGLLDSVQDPSLQQCQLVDRLLDKALKKKPDSVFLLLCLAALRDKQRNYAEAERLYGEVLQRDPRNWVALNNLAWLLAVAERQFGNALNHIQQAIHLAGPRAELLDTRALVYLLVGNVSGSLQDLQAAVKVAPKATTYLHLAQAQQKAENRDEAVASLRKALDLKVAHNLHPLERPAFNQLLEVLGKK
jgi:tetratricopeptide (TPR) repeat protein